MSNLAEYPFVCKHLDATHSYNADVEFVKEHLDFTMLEEMYLNSLNEDDALLCKRVICKRKVDSFHHKIKYVEPVEYSNKEEYEACLVETQKKLSRAMSMADQCAESETVYIDHKEYNAGLLPNGESLIVLHVEYLQKVNGTMMNMTWFSFKEQEHMCDFTWLNTACPLFGGKVIPY